jgi:hypothetical protein
MFSEELMVTFYQQDGVSKHETYYPALGYLSRGFMHGKFVLVSEGSGA